MRHVRFVALLAASAFAAGARADVVRLRNGGKVEGEVVSETPTTIVVNSAGGKVVLDRALVESVERVARVVPVERTATKTGAHFSVTCHFDDEACAAEALAAAEAAWPATLELLGAEPPTIEHPLDVHIYRDPAEFAAVDAKLTGGKMAGDHSGFADPRTRTAHLLVKPDYDDAVWRRVGVPRDCLASVAHEASHLTVQACIDNGARFPSWLAEGIALHVETKVRIALGAGAGVGPSMRTYRCRDLRKCGLLAEPRALLQSRVDHLDPQDRYALYATFFEFLLRPERLKQTNALFATIRATPAGDDFGARLTAAIDATWDGAALDEMNDAFRRYVDSLQPTWDVWWGHMDVAGARWVQWSDDDDGTYAFPAPPIRAKKYIISGSFELAAGAARQAGVVVGEADAGRVVVLFDANDGVCVQEYRSADKQWHDVEFDGAAKTRRIADAKTSFEIHVVGDAIHVALDGNDVGSVSLKGRGLSGSWGVYAHAKSAVIWTDVALKESARPPRDDVTPR